MGRIIHTTNPTRQRRSVLKKMASAIQNFSKSPQSDESVSEFTATLIASLQEIRDSVDRTAAAWEKRDYWLKADAFRRQWSWVEKRHTGLKNLMPSGSPADLRRQIQDLGEELENLRLQ